MAAALTAPLRLAGRTAPSRVVFGPHVTNLGDGRRFSRRHTAYYERRARGGAGVVVTEIASIHPGDQPYERAPLAGGNEAGWAEIAGACRPYGTLVLAGLGHAGLEGSSAWTRSALWGPSRVADPATRELPMEMESTEIAAVIDGFASASGAARDAGADGVEIDIGVRSLLRQFHSGLTNHRADDYGRDRTRLTREVITAARQAVGPGILALRICCDELAPWAGITPDSALGTVRELAPLVDLITVVRGGLYSPHAYRPDFHVEPNFNTDLCRRMRRAAGTTPIVLQGSVVDASAAGSALADGTADLIEMTRAQIADPDLVRKSAEGRTPRPCVLCNQTCQVLDPRNPIVSCTGNPDAGDELGVPPTRMPATPGDVLVVGGGPAGLEAAREAAERGRPVRLAERSSRLGGAVAELGPLVPHLLPLMDWLADECERLGVRIDLGTEVSRADIDREIRSGATVLVSEGSVPPENPMPPMRQLAPGSGPHWMPAAAVPRGVPDGAVVVWDPVGGPSGVAVATALAEEGREVTYATPDAVVGSRLAASGDRSGAGERIQRGGVHRILRSEIAGWDQNGVRFRDRYTGETRTAECAVVVDCSPGGPRRALHGTGAARLGDCVAPRTVAEAIRDGRVAARQVLERESDTSSTIWRTTWDCSTAR